ncbi:putative MFS family arabinose efflux permease [Motilibacter peucedani]|uniref:Putative MFS family arabinose efflux permease n=1 Tax=Motilibacter peucedani TaxID=598650 RepID=A0A420XNP8_9ACTN|nr:putative MFS family arabinose efflux permease [Motilibacter peucedani]
MLRHRQAAVPFAASLIARLSFSLAPLSMVLLVSHVRDSYGDAGLVTGAYGIGTALGSPTLGRALDRFGQPRVVVPAGVLCGALLVVLALLAAADAPLAVLVALAAVAGASFPPLGPAMRTAWRVIFPDQTLRRAGYALDAVAVETIFIVGPLLLSLLVTRTPAAVPLVLTGTLLAAGCVGYASCAAPRQVVPHEQSPKSERGGSAARIGGMPALLVVVLGLAVAFGSIDTSLAATAREVLHDQSKLGWLFTAIAGGSAVGGLTYGARASHAPGTEQRRIPLPLLTFSLALVPVSLLLHAGRPPLGVLLPILFVAGLSISPTIIMCQNLIDVLSPPERVNEAQAWMSSSITTGAACGTAVAGVVIDAVGVPGSFGNAAGATALAALAALAAQRVWRRRVAVLAQ